MVVLLESSTFSTGDFWSSVSDYWVLGHLPDQGSSEPKAQFGWAVSSGKSLGGSKPLPFNLYGSVHVFFFLSFFFLPDLMC